MQVKSHVAERASRHKHLDGGVVFAESIPRLLIYIQMGTFSSES